MYQAEKFWDKMAKWQDNDNKRFKQLNLKIIAKTRELLNTGDIVLDFGCGNGFITFNFADLVKEIHALDISSKVINIAKTRASERKIENVLFSQTALFDDRLNKGYYDVVLAFNILHLLNDPRQAISRIFELLKPGGVVVTSTPCLGEHMSVAMKLQFSIFCLLNKLDLFPHVQRFSFTELNNLITFSGLQTIASQDLYQGIFGYFIAAKKPHQTN